MTAPVSKRKKLFLTAAIAAFVILLPLIVSAQPTIISVTKDPINPGFGEPFELTLTYCGQLYNAHTGAIAISTSPNFLDAQISGSGQVFVYSSRGEDVHFGAANPGEQIGGIISPSPGGPPTNCTHCEGGQGVIITRVFNLTMPAEEDFPGCNNTNFYVHIGMKDNNLAESEWDTISGGTCGDDDTYTSAAWSIPVPTADYTIHKRAEGVLQDVGDLLLYSIDFEYGNGPLVITDDLPFPATGQFTIDSVGPLGTYTISNGAIGSPVAANTGITWTLPNRTGMVGKASGTVWVLLRMTGDIDDNTDITNTVNGNMNGNIKTSSITTTVGKAVINLVKSQSSDVVSFNDTITYILEYSINGSKLVGYQSFDDIAAGNYTPAPPGWINSGPGIDHWQVVDECGTGDRILKGYSPLGGYPGLLYDDLFGSPNGFCEGIIMSDIMISADYEGADAMINIRNNNKPGTAASIAYGLVLSVDENIGNNSDGSIGFQRCVGTGASACIWPSSGQPKMNIETNRWYRVKVEATGPFAFRAKVWAKGDAEPVGWDVTWTDTAPPAGGACTDDIWYTGVAQQGGDAGTFVNDHYNNFLIYEPRESLNTVLTDPIPTGIVRLGQTGSPMPLSPLTWNLGTLSNEGGSFTWWGQVTQCDLITNMGTLSGTGVAAVDSNEVVLTVNCIEDVSLVKTANPNLIDLGDEVTFTLCWENTGELPSNIVITDPIPPRTTVTGINNGGTGVSVGATSGTITWNIGTQLPGASGCVSWRGRIN